MRLAGKVAFVSGGARGMGAAEARLFAREGAHVAFGDVLDDEGRKVEAEINETGGQALYVHLDVTQPESWQAAMDATIQAFGRLDVLVNNAGVLVEGTHDDATIENWDRVMDVNARGVFLGVMAAIPHMRATGGGSIVNISSISGIIGQEHIHAGYNASKGAVRLLTKSIAIQYAKEGIRVNSVHPGGVETPMTAAGRADPERYARAIASTPLGRYGVPDDIAYGVLFLASDESSYMTGSELVIDGGYTAQ